MQVVIIERYDDALVVSHRAGDLLSAMTVHCCQHVRVHEHVPSVALGGRRPEVVSEVANVLLPGLGCSAGAGYR